MPKHVLVDGYGAVEFPDEMDDQSIFAKVKQAFSSAPKYIEPALAIGSSAVAEPLSGLAGIGALLSGKSASDAATTIGQAQSAMTYQPRTEQGAQGLRAVQNALQPIGDIIQGASQNLGDMAYNSTGSPALAAAAYSAPTAMLEGLGVKGLGIARNPVSAADLYSARMGMGKVDDGLSPLVNAVYANKDSFFDGGEFDYDAYRRAVYDAEDAIDQDVFDLWQNSDWQSSSRALISDSDAQKLIPKVESKTLYHGSPFDFEEINLPEDGGAFLTSSKDSASHYADGGNVYEYKISPKKPFFVSGTDATLDIDYSGELAKLKAQGYDSVIPLDDGDYIVLDRSILKKVK